MRVHLRLRHAFGLLVGLMLAITSSCNAPHDNPFDPALGGNVAGRVLTRRATPIAGALVRVAVAGREDVTDSAGAFYISGLPDDSVWVTMQSDSFLADSAFVGLEKGHVDTVTRYLDGLPYIRTCRVTSHVYGRSWPPRPLQFCRLAADAGDVDGDADIESVWVKIPDLTVSRRLLFEPGSRQYQATLWADSLPGLSIETLVGLNVRFYVSDRESAETRGPDCALGRIITDLPSIAFPAGGLDTVAADTTFYWHRFNHGYNVSYHCEVTRIVGGGPGGLAASFDTPQSADTSHRVSRALLEPGDYYWTVEAIDTQGNSCRTIEELFSVR